MRASDFRRRAIMLTHQQNRTKRRSTLAFLQTLELQQSSCHGARSSDTPSPHRKLLLRRRERDTNEEGYNGSALLVGLPASPKDTVDDDDMTHATSTCSLSDCDESCADGQSLAEEDDHRSHGPATQDCGSVVDARTTRDDDTFVTATSRFPSPAAGGFDLGSSGPFVIGVATPQRRTWANRKKATQAGTRRTTTKDKNEEEDMLTRQIEMWAREAEEAHQHRRKRVCQTLRVASCSADDRSEEVRQKQVTPVAAKVCRLGAEGCDDSSQVHVAESCIRLSLALSLCLLCYC